MKTFLGYKQNDGRVGIRNHILILPASICASDVTRMVASKVNGAVSFNNQLGCSQVGIDFEYTLDVMSGFAANPNIYGTIVVSLGCENAQMMLVKQEIEKRTNKPLLGFIIQEEGGTIKTIEKVEKAARKMVKEAQNSKRQKYHINKLIVATECGGSDPTSGLGANPVVGALSDYFVENGATTILSETTEFIGAEHILARRAKDEKVKSDIYKIINRFEEHIKINTGLDVRCGNPSYGNKKGGLTTLEEKSLGCIHKGGESIINKVYDYAKQISTNEGLVIMDTPGNDPASVAGMIAGGAQLVLFTTGRGTPTGNPIAPVIKLTANKTTYEKMSDSLDVDLSDVIHKQLSIDKARDMLLEEVLKIVNGKLTKSEKFGFIEMAIQRGANFV